MLKSKKFYTYEAAQGYELKQEQLEGYKQRGRVFEDFAFFYEMMGIGIHPCLKQPYGREHTEPSILSFVSTAIDISTLKILFYILPNAKILTLKFCANEFEISNLEFLINSLLTKPNNVYNFIFEWNGRIRLDGSYYELSNNNTSENSENKNYVVANDPLIVGILLNCQQVLVKLATSPKLEALCLRGNFLGDETVSLLFNNLQTNNCLKVLNLFKNNLTSKCMPSFCTMIEQNKKVEEINLGGNFLKDEDLAMFKEYVGRIPMSLEQVETHNKKVKDRDFILEKNKKLKIQKKPEEHVPVLDEVMLIGDVYYTIKNSNLKNLNLMQNLFTSECFDDLVFILDYNADLLLTMDGKIFSKNQKDILIDPFGKYANRVYLTK